METKNKITADMRTALRADFPKEAYSQHPTKTFLTTLKAMYVTERLNDVFGLGRWTIDHLVVERTADYVLIQGEFIALDYEVKIPSQYGGHTTTGKNTEIADGYKSAITDCISKIASYMEIGIDMFKGKIVVDKSAKAYPEDSRAWLADAGYKYLIEKGTKEEINTAFADRKMKKDYKIALTAKLNSLL